MINKLEFDGLSNTFSMEFAEKIELIKNPIPDGDTMHYPTEEEKEIKTNTRNYSEIAEAIQEKGNMRNPLLPCDMAEAVNGVYTEGEKVGYNAGRNEGYEAGKCDGYAEGFDVGGQTERAVFWDGFLLNGERRNFNNAFAYGGSVSTTPWTNQNFKPNHTMKPTYANNMFTKFGYVGDLTETADIDFSLCYEMDGAFVNCPYITRLGIIDFRVLSSCSGIIINNMQSLETIDKLVFRDDSNDVLIKNGLTFPKCGALMNVDVEGVIDFDINFSSSPLNLESATSVIMALKSLAENRFNREVIFSEQTKGLLDEAGEIFPQGYWSDYLIHLGWNF